MKLDKARQEDLEIRNALEKCEKLEKEARARRDARERCESRVPLRELIPSREVSDELVQAYLRTTEPVLRVIHAPSFMSQYKQYWEIPQPSNEVFIAKLLLVLAIGTCFSRQEAFAPLRSSATRWICAVQGWVKSSAWESRITLSCVQFHCLLLIARQTCCVGKKQLWASASSLLQTAMELGLHRSPRFIPEVDVFEAEMRRRLWATVAELLVQTSIDAGTAPMLSSDDFDCEPPSNIDDHQLHEGSVALPTPKPMNHFTETTTQILLQRSLPVRLEIARYLNHFRSDGSYSTALRLHAELSHVLGSHARLLDLASHPTASFIFHKKLFTLLTHRFFIALHQLFALRAPKDATFCISRTVCFSSSVLLLSLAQPSSPAPDLPIDTNAATASAFVSSQSSSSSRSARAPSSTDQWSDDFARLMCRGSGMFGEATLRAAIAVGFEVVVQHRQRNRQHVATYNRPETQASGLGDTEAEAEDKGRQAVEEFVSLSMERIRIVGDLFKSNLLFVVILAMVNSSEGEEEARVKFAMRENLRFWLEVLKERVEEFSEGVVRGGLGSQTSVAAGNVWTGETEVVQDDQGGNGMPAEGAGDFQWFGMVSDFEFLSGFTNLPEATMSCENIEQDDRLANMYAGLGYRLQFRFYQCRPGHAKLRRTILGDPIHPLGGLTQVPLAERPDEPIGCLTPYKLAFTLRITDFRSGELHMTRVISLTDPDPDPEPQGN